MPAHLHLYGCLAKTRHRSFITGPGSAVIDGDCDDINKMFTAAEEIVRCIRGIGSVMQILSRYQDNNDTNNLNNNYNNTFI